MGRWAEGWHAHLARDFTRVTPVPLQRNDSPGLFVYRREPQKTGKKGESKGKRGRVMKEATDVLKIVGMVLLALFVLAVGVPLVLALAGVVLGFLVTLAVWAIKIAIVMAVVYLIVVGIRAVLR
jgi:hypothetical protein